MKLPENVNWLIIQACNFKKIDYNSVFDKSRKREITEARYIVMYILYKYSDYSVTEIGYYFNKDHASVIHSKKTIENLCSTNKFFKCFFDELELKYTELYSPNKCNELTLKYKRGAFKRHKLIILDVVNNDCTDDILSISIARALVCH